MENKFQMRMQNPVNVERVTINLDGLTDEQKLSILNDLIKWSNYHINYILTHKE